MLSTAMPSPSLLIPNIVNDTGNTSDSGSVSGTESSAIAPPRFPHTRAQLSAIAKEFKPFGYINTDSDTDGENVIRISTSLVKQVANLLENEQEDELKSLLKQTFSGMGDDIAEQHVLDLMHKHRDDVAGVPFLFLTPTRRPISRPSSRASIHSLRIRPDTPTSVPNSPSMLVFKRPHTPATSPLATGHNTTSYISNSPSASPTLPYPSVFPTSHSYLATSLPASPLSSPRLLNAKASEFRPTPRPVSAAAAHPPSSLSGLRAETPSPDLWAHGTSRSSSRLAIASPIVPDDSLISGPRALTPNSSLRASALPGDDDDNDPFDPFTAKSQPRSFHSVNNGANPADFDAQLSNSSNSTSSLSEDQSYAVTYAQENENELDHEQYTFFDGIGLYEPEHDDNGLVNEQEIDPDAAAILTDGMTPFDVLSSVFGATLAPSELEEALANNGYDFERAMQWLVERALPTQQQSVPPSTNRGLLGSGVHVVPRNNGYFRGGRGHYPAPAQRGGRFINGRPIQGGNRVCRYFLAGECMRADCRFSHDLERALCRFWLRGTCAKQENCEFLHHLPDNFDISGLTAAMGRTDINASHDVESQQVADEFPQLSHDLAINRHGGVGNFGHDRYLRDPARTRFANAVKKVVPPTPVAAPKPPVDHAARREALNALGDSVHLRPTVVAPRPSPRLKLRPPSLLPTVTTGESVNSLYMSYRSRALQLGAARNACLSRAADAWRRGDGQAAKRFSREGHELNVKMSTEASTAADNLIRERARQAEMSVRNRDLNWSDDPGDRTSRGRVYGGGLGVCLGIASTSVGDGKQSAEERTEVVLDLHGLHANEATEVLEEFLPALEKEYFFGLAYIIVGEEKHTGARDGMRGATRLATGVREWLHNWGYPWNERDGVICVDPLTHME